MRKEVYIFGSGGHGKVVASLFQANGIKPKGFLDENQDKFGKKNLGIPVLGGFQFFEKFLFKKKRSLACFIVAIGDNEKRKQIFQILKKKEIHLVSVFHPSCILHPSVKIGKGTAVMPGVIINADSHIGEDAILNTGVSIDHDCVIGDHAHLAPGVILAGNVTVEEKAFLGVGACVIPGVKIGASAIVGAGAVVLQDVLPGQKVAGIPARPLD